MGSGGHGLRGGRPGLGGQDRAWAAWAVARAAAAPGRRDWQNRCDSAGLERLGLR
jgi:hypothetical protein